MNFHDRHNSGRQREEPVNRVLRLLRHHRLYSKSMVSFTHSDPLLLHTYLYCSPLQAHFLECPKEYHRLIHSSTLHVLLFMY